MGNNSDAVGILILIGLGYLGLKTVQKSVGRHVSTQYVEPFKRLKAGTSTHYSPYSQRYFKKGILRRSLYG